MTMFATDTMGLLENCSISIEDLVAGLATVPGVRIDREQYVGSALRMWTTDEQAEQAILTTPAKAGVSPELIDMLAEDAISYENNLATAASIAVGLPSSLATMAPAAAADLSQFYAHVIRVAQKLGYLYGWNDIFDLNGEKMDDATRNVIFMFLGVMSGIEAAERGLMTVAKSAAVATEKRLVAKALTKGAVYPVVKRVAFALGIQMDKKLFSQMAGKSIPLAGGAISGIVTYASFSTMAHRLKNYLATTPLAAPNLVSVIEVEDYEVSD